MNERRPTSTDVAQRAGVSRSTVSYVLNDRTDRHLPEATRQKVLDAARELGYVPNPSARALRGKLPPVILGLAPALPFGRIVGVVTDTLTDLAQEHGFSLVSMRGGDASALETALVYLQPRLVLSYALPTPEERAVLERFRIPVAPQHDGLPGAESGDPVARMQVRALHGAGRHRLAYLGTVDPALAPLDGPRGAGVERACAEAGDHPAEVVRLPLPTTSQELGELRAVLRRWRALDPPVDGVACYNDLWASALLHAAREEGVAVPGDMSVIGLDDEPMGAHLDPPLTTIDVDPAGMARAVFADGLSLIDPITEVEGAAPRFRLVERASL